MQARRYADLRERGSHDVMNVYAVPDSAGVATVACFATPASAATFLPRCEREASTLRLTGARTYPAAPSGGYARRLSAILGRLATGQRAGHSDLQSAGSPDAQGLAAVRLARVYAHTRTQLEALRAPGAAERLQSALRAALARTQTAYARMAEAVVASDSAKYDAAVHDAEGGESAIRHALAALRPLGYSPA
jgi:hypothetical protein